METHPDVAKEAGNEERFKQISAAHTVLSNEKERRRYDFELQEATRFGVDRRTVSNSYGFSDSPHDGMNRKGSRMNSLFDNLLGGVLRPRNLFLGVTLGVVTVAYFNASYAKDDQVSRTGKSNLVEAWRNPLTGKWEQPKPWDKTYRNLQPTLHLIPREKVQETRR